MSGPFVFDSYAFDRPTATLNLTYRYNGGATFVETIVFPAITRELSANDWAALDLSFRLLFLLAGVSYYKAYVPTELRCEAFALDPITASFVEKVYRHGLGEFSYQNKLDLTDRVHFVSSDVAAPQPIPLNLKHHLCVPVGGGKDSIVTLEYLKEAGEPVTLFALGGTSGTAGPIQATIDVSGLPAIKVARTLSPKLIELNKAGAYNGHVPITAILSAITVAAAIMQGFDTIVMSNEHSASAPNVRYNNLEINHQYSKSFEFEKDLSCYIGEHITPQLSYFSLLRPLSETDITRRFAKLKKYHSVFRSCNTAFRQDAKARGKHWCCNCPKCRFVFLALAPFVDKPRLIDIFGANMLDDAAQTEGFAELCGLSAHKPFECVGEIEESSLLMQKLAHMSAWQKDHVVSNLGPKCAPNPQGLDDRFNALFQLHPDHHVPAPYLKLLYARD